MNIVFLLIALFMTSIAQNKSISIRTFGTFQNVLAKKENSIIFWKSPNPDSIPNRLLIDQIESGSGFGGGGQFSYNLFKGVDINLRIEYNYLFIKQSNGLAIWNWDYWNVTYTDYLIGEIFTVFISPTNDTVKSRDSLKDIIYRDKKIQSVDGHYEAEFEPIQRLKELMISGGVEYEFSPYNRFFFLTGCNFGISKFFRQLEMREHWIKRFDLDTVKGYDFDYKFELTQFAPQKKGTKLFIAPTVGLRYKISSYLDLDYRASYLYYLDDTFEFLDKMFGISNQTHLNFPLRSKFQNHLGLVFKY